MKNSYTIKGMFIRQLPVSLKQLDAPCILYNLNGCYNSLKEFVFEYQKNTPAISFYQREGFEIQYSGLDEVTGEKDYVMAWERTSSSVEFK